MPGHGSLMHRLPEPSPSMVLPSLSTISGTTPNSGRVAEPALRSVAPGSGAIRMPPFSVCHQVSTTGHFFSPTTSKYHSHASGLIGSPTEPRMRRLLREDFFTHSSPAPLSARIAVGAV